MNEGINIEHFIQAIQRLQSDRPVCDPQKWYKTQKEHWLGWLSEYNAPGAYNRQTGKTRDAQYVYNHIVEPKMLLWLIEAGGIEPVAIRAAKDALLQPVTMQAKSAAIRRIVPWEALKRVLWNTDTKK